MDSDLIFQGNPDVLFGGNIFRHVPVILQYEDTPLLEVGQYADAGYTSRISVFHPDGTKIAVVKGRRIFLTEEGEKANLKLHYEQNVIACELDGRALIELRKDGPAALAGWAELHTPDGVLVKVNDSRVGAQLNSGEPLQLGGLLMHGNLIANARIGIHVTRQSVGIGVF